MITNDQQDCATQSTWFDDEFVGCIRYDSASKTAHLAICTGECQVLARYLNVRSASLRAAVRRVQRRARDMGVVLDRVLYRIDGKPQLRGYGDWYRWKD